MVTSYHIMVYCTNISIWPQTYVKIFYHRVTGMSKVYLILSLLPSDHHSRSPDSGPGTVVRDTHTLFPSSDLSLLAFLLPNSFKRHNLIELIKLCFSFGELLIGRLPTSGSRLAPYVQPRLTAFAECAWTFCEDVVMKDFPKRGTVRHGRLEYIYLRSSNL